MQQQFQNTSVNLDGLLEVLGKNLYSSASVAIRELIQNSHDACERHRIENGDKDFGITLSSDSDNRTLTITDNGSGLTRQEIIEYLATIGSGYTRVLRNETGSDKMIGYFGLGFLSAYVVSDKVEVWSTSYKDPESCWFFASAGGKTFTLTESAPRAVGTTVTLYLKKEFEHLSEGDVLFRLVSLYCCLLPIPIFLNGEKQAINQLVNPFVDVEQVSELRLRKMRLEFAAIFENTFEPITCLAIPEDNELGLRGVLWVQDGGSYVSTDTRNVNVFIRNMFISDQEKDLLPNWAGFCGAVLDSVYFQPTASRETLQKNDYYKKVQSFLHDFLVTQLRKLVLKEPESWRQIMRQHNQALLGAAVSDSRLLEVMSSSLLVPTTLGEMTIVNLLKQSNNTVYVKADVENSEQDILFQAKSIPLVLGYRFAASEFCRLCAQKNNFKFQLIGFRDFDQSLFSKADINGDDSAYLLSLFDQGGQRIHFSKFEPVNIPMLLIEDQEVKLKNKIEGEQSDRRIGAAALALARIHTSKTSNQVTHHLYLNLSSPLIKKVLSQKSELSSQVARLAFSVMGSIANQKSASGDQSVNYLDAINQQLMQILKEEE